MAHRFVVDRTDQGGRLEKKSLAAHAVRLFPLNLTWSIIHLFTKSGSGHAHTMHNLWRLGVVAMAEPITNYFRVENACAPNMKTYVTFIAVVGRATPTRPPSQFTTPFGLTTHPQHQHLLIRLHSESLATIMAQRDMSVVVVVTSFPRQIVLFFRFVC
jgi:hypothetical protein